MLRTSVRTSASLPVVVHPLEHFVQLAYRCQFCFHNQVAMVRYRLMRQRQVGASTAAVALKRGMNACSVHRWLREHSRGTLSDKPLAFVPVTLMPQLTDPLPADFRPKRPQFVQIPGIARLLQRLPGHKRQGLRSRKCEILLHTKSCTRVRARVMV